VPIRYRQNPVCSCVIRTRRRSLIDTELPFTSMKMDAGDISISLGGHRKEISKIN
jgi:hypothetical protein